MRFFATTSMLLAAVAAVGLVSFVPAGSATTCDPVTGNACVGSTSVGTCSNGYQGNFAYVYRNDGNGFVYVVASTFCYGGFGGSGNGITAGGSQCDASYSNCASAGVSWFASSSAGGSSCGSAVYVDALGAPNHRDLPLCDVVGAPPVIPSLGLP